MKVNYQVIKNILSATATVGFVTGTVVAIVLNAKVVAIALAVFSCISLVYLTVSLIKERLSSRVTANMPECGKTKNGFLSHLDLTNEKMNLIIKDLKLLSNDNFFLATSFLNKKQGDICEAGGIPLIDSDNVDEFVGFVAVKEREEGSGCVLYICPGAGNQSFDKEYFDLKMPDVINKLKELEIIPLYFVVDGRHPGNTLRCFQQWQGVDEDSLVELQK